MGYFTQLWQRAFRLNSLPFQLDQRLFRLPQGWNITFGLWVKYTVDSPGQAPSTSATTQFVYNPLKQCGKEVRLLEIDPGNPEDVITATMIHVDLAQAPPYEALSYVWGDYYQDRASIELDGHAFDLHAELFNAIHTLRLPDTPRLIWADAICIDQTNIKEKNHQVRIMGHIYESAKSVVVYLGKPTERTEDAMRCMKFFTEPVNELRQDAPWSHSELEEVEHNLADIINRKWFSRMWTIQEATLARHTTLLCGPHQVSWPGDFPSMKSIMFRIKSAAISPFFSTTARTIGRLDWSPLVNILETQTRQAARKEGFTLRRNHLDLAWDFRHRQCADPRDKHFAIFGIMDNDLDGELALLPDYTVPLEELHENFTAAIRRIGEEELVSEYLFRERMSPQNFVINDE